MSRSQGRIAGILLVMLTLGLLPGCREEKVEQPLQAAPEVGYKTFQGAWFEVRYPAAFSVKPSLPSRTAEGYDSAEFVSPNESVAFYVFAPQWGGEASDIAFNPEAETLVDERTEQQGDRELRWFTIAAKDGSYRRSYLETVAQQGAVKTVIGIWYRDAAALKRYQRQYQEFRDSLEQFAD